MTQWNYKLKIKQHLGEEETVQAMQAALDGITKELRAVPVAPPEKFFGYAKLAIREDDIQVFNLGMDALYDWGDTHRIWLG